MSADGSRERPGGPLSPHAAGFRSFLDRQGYCSQQIGQQLGLMTQLSWWLAGQGMGAQDFTGQVADRFAGVMRATRRSLISRRAPAPLLTCLRELAVVPAGQPADHAPRGIVAGSCRDYLRGERGLAEGTVSEHLRFARAFLAELDDPLDEALAALSAGQMLAIVARQVREQRSASSARNLASSIRTLLRFLSGRGYAGADLAPVILRVAPWRLTSGAALEDPRRRDQRVLPRRVSGSPKPALQSCCDILERYRLNPEFISRRIGVCSGGPMNASGRVSAAGDLWSGSGTSCRHAS